jgi:hypothetical protein
VAKPFLVIFGAEPELVRGNLTNACRSPYTAAERSGSSNFVGSFRSGTCCSALSSCYRPKDELPDIYGINNTSFPESFGAQMLYPFLR